MYDTFVKLRNETQKVKYKAKSEYYTQKVEEHKHHPQKLWKTLKSLGSSKAKSKSASIGLKVDNNICFDNKTVANKFNEFFTTIASTLIDKLPPGSGNFGSSHFRNFYKKLGIAPNKFGFAVCTEEQVRKALDDITSVKPQA